MSQKPLSVKEIRALINKGEASDPLVFLESVMNGQDPRRLSSIYRLVHDINDFSGGDLTPSDWAEIVDHVTERYQYHVTHISESMSAAKTLAEYLHPKRKQVEISGMGEGTNVASSPLTDDEIELFKEKFNDEF